MSLSLRYPNHTSDLHADASRINNLRAWCLSVRKCNHVRKIHTLHKKEKVRRVAMADPAEKQCKDAERMQQDLQAALKRYTEVLGAVHDDLAVVEHFDALATIREPSEKELEILVCSMGILGMIDVVDPTVVGAKGKKKMKAQWDGRMGEKEAAEWEKLVGQLEDQGALVLNHMDEFDVMHSKPEPQLMGYRVHRDYDPESAALQALGLGAAVVILGRWSSSLLKVWQCRMEIESAAEEQRRQAARVERLRVREETRLQREATLQRQTRLQKRMQGQVVVMPQQTIKKVTDAPVTSQIANREAPEASTTPMPTAPQGTPSTSKTKKKKNQMFKIAKKGADGRWIT